MDYSIVFCDLAEVTPTANDENLFDALMVESGFDSAILIPNPPMQLPFAAVFVPPTNTAICEILTPGAYFMPPGISEFNRNILDRVDEQQIINAANNATLKIYSYLSKRIAVKCHYV